MAITGPASYIPTINEFLSHWASCNTALPPASPFLLQLPATNTTIPRSQFVSMRDSLQLQQGVVQGCLTDQQVARGPNDPREFVMPFGLNQPGAEVAQKVYVILTTGNEAGSAAMFVERPANVLLAA